MPWFFSCIEKTTEDSEGFPVRMQLNVNGGLETRDEAIEMAQTSLSMVKSRMVQGLDYDMGPKIIWEEPLLV